MSASNITTNIPAPILSDTGLTLPSEQDILTGALADLTAALGGSDETSLTTPQGQIAISETAILSANFAALGALFNGIDPAVASGRMQEAIGRIYFMERRPATATTVTVQAIINGAGQTIAAGTPIALDSAGYLYASTNALTLPANGTASFTLTCQTPGAILCEANSLSLYQAGLGIASLSNPSPGITGSNTETRADFETRRQASVAANSTGQNASLLGTLLSIEGVTDAYVQDNPNTTETVLNGITMPPHSLYCVIAGGNSTAIGQALLQTKPPGCATVGNQTIRVQDTNTLYNGYGPFYTFSYDVAQTTPLSISVTLAQNSGLPADSVTQVQNALINALENGPSRAHLGAPLYASRLMGVLNALGDWADVLSLTLGVGEQTGLTTLTLPINQIASLSSTAISVGFG